MNSAVAATTHSSTPMHRTAVYQNVALSEVCMHTILEIVTFTCEIVVQKNFRNCYVIIMWHTTLNRLRVKVMPLMMRHFLEQQLLQRPYAVR